MLTLPQSVLQKGAWKITFLKKSDKELVFRGLILLLVSGWPWLCCCPPGEICWMATGPGTCKVVPVTCWELRLPARAWALRGWIEPVTACAWPPTLTWTGKNVIPPFSLAIPAVCYKEEKNVDMKFFLSSPSSIAILDWHFPNLRWLSHKCQRTQSLYLPFLTLYWNGHCLPIVGCDSGCCHSDQGLSGNWCDRNSLPRHILHGDGVD